MNGQIIINRDFNGGHQEEFYYALQDGPLKAVVNIVFSSYLGGVGE